MNILTNAMNKMTKMLLDSDSKLKEYGKEPYGIKKLTPKEQRDEYDNLTPDKLKAMIQEHGVEEVNKWMSRFEKEGSNG